MQRFSQRKTSQGATTWEVMTALASVVAITISLFPYFIDLFAGERVEASLNGLAINHQVGLLEFKGDVVIRNVGLVPTTIGRLFLVVRPEDVSDGTHDSVYHASMVLDQSSSVRNSAGMPFPFGVIQLPAKSAWVGQVLFRSSINSTDAEFIDSVRERTIDLTRDMLSSATPANSSDLQPLVPGLPGPQVSMQQRQQGIAIESDLKAFYAQKLRSFSIGKYSFYLIAYNANRRDLERRQLDVAGYQAHVEKFQAKRLVQSSFYEGIPDDVVNPMSQWIHGGNTIELALEGTSRTATEVRDLLSKQHPELSHE